MILHTHEVKNHFTGYRTKCGDILLEMLHVLVECIDLTSLLDTPAFTHHIAYVL
jgi:hypothetical protein